MNRMQRNFLLLLLLGFHFVSAQRTKTVWLDDLSIQTYSEGLRPVSVKTNYSHDTMRINGVVYQRGIGVQTICVLSFRLDRHAKRFSATIGRDDQANKEIPVVFYVIGDQKVLYQSREMMIGDQPENIDIDITGVRQLGLLVTDKIGGIRNKRAYANWADAKFEMEEGYEPEHTLNTDEKYILTPPVAKSPAIHSATLFGATPGNPFLYTIAATGERPMKFFAKNLPKGLTVSAETGIITGKVEQRGKYTVMLTAKNKYGTASRKLEIRIGDTISLTPPIGWNGWNSWEQKIDREKVLASANAMVSTGLRDHGWTYVNIDDAWQGVRGGPDTALQPNEKFPDIKGMVDHIHSLGLKAGIYSTPYIASYGGYVGASSDYPAGGETHALFKKNRPAYSHIGPYRFEKNDAKQMAAWGFDFLKYDWRIDVNSTQRMSDALKQSGRDIVFSLSNNAPFEKVADWARLSNMYRTGPDIKDSWTSLYYNAFFLDEWGPYAGHGHWSDPDMMIVGKVSIGPVLHDTRLTPDEQYSHVSIFSLLSAPLLIGCPLEQLDSFTLNLLSNDEVIAINQDPLGKPARLVKDHDGVQVWLKQMEDGSFAAGLFNIDGYGTTPQSYFRWGNEMPRNYEFDIASIGLKGKWKLRNVWTQKDEGVVSGVFNTKIRHHGVVLLRLFPVK